MYQHGAKELAHPGAALGRLLRRVPTPTASAGRALEARRDPRREAAGP